MSARGITALLTALLASAPVAAHTIAITNVRILSMGRAGEVARGTVVIRDGRIAAVGAEIAIPADARLIDGKGGVVTPGFVLADGRMGLMDVSQVPLSVDRAQHNPALSAAFDVSQGLNPDSVVIPVARLGGITRAILAPDYDDKGDRDLQFAGQAAVVDLGQRPDMVMRPRVAMILELGENGAERAGGARGAALAELRATLADVRDYARRRAAYERGQTRDYRLSRVDLEALVPVVEGRMPIVVTVDRASDILEVLALAREERLKIILDGAAEGWRVADRIAQANVPVILDARLDLPNSFEQLGARNDNAARLFAAGVTITIKDGEGGSYRARELRYDTGHAVAHGLPYAAALAAITINPAKMFGIDDRVGSLDIGKDADVVLWSGDPLEPLSQPGAIFVRGIEQSLTTRQTELRDRYLAKQPLGGAGAP
ncbi:MAG: amidohydrolase family protein [Pseudomonadota bacterium]